MAGIDVEGVIGQCRAVFNALINNGDSLSRQEAIEALGDGNSSNYGIVVDGLASIGKITKLRGRLGGIKYSPARARQRKLTDANIQGLRRFLSNIELEVPDVVEDLNASLEDEKYKKQEETLYNPLRDYLDEGGDFDFVEIYGDSRGGGGKWKNPDLVALSYSPKLKYHAGLQPRVSTFEVKFHWPTITDVQQTASYLRFCHYAFACFFDSSYKGKDANQLLSKLKTTEIWEWSDLYQIGLIVAFRKQDRSPGFAFQIIRDAPFSSADPDAIEKGIDTYFSDKTKKVLVDAQKQQMKALLQF